MAKHKRNLEQIRHQKGKPADLYIFILIFMDLSSENSLHLSGGERKADGGGQRGVEECQAAVPMICQRKRDPRSGRKQGINHSHDQIL